MKSVKLSIVTAVMVIGGFVVEAGAEDLTASSTFPSVYYDDTNYGALGNEWVTYSNVYNTSTGAGYWTLWDKNSNSTPILINAYTNPVPGIPQAHYALWSKANGEVCLAEDALCIRRSANDINSLAVNSNGDVTLANGSIIIDRSNRRVGIGGIIPREKVDVMSYVDAARFQLTSITNTQNEAAQFIQRRARAGASINVKSGDNIGLFSFRGHTGSGFTGSKAVIAVAATEDWSGSRNGNQISFRHTRNGSNTMVTALQIKGNADVYIPNGHLYVRGINVPDYVFDENYKLMPLDELKAYVDKNNHLPGIASANEVDKAGVVNLSGLQMTLLEKVEELTLYTLQQEEALREAKEEMNEKDRDIKVMKVEMNIKQKAQDEKIAKLESLLDSITLDLSQADR